MEEPSFKDLEENSFKDFGGNLFQRFWKKIVSKMFEDIYIYIFLLSDKSRNLCKIVSVLVSAWVERFFVPHMLDFF